MREAAPSKTARYDPGGPLSVHFTRRRDHRFYGGQGSHIYFHGEEESAASSLAEILDINMVQLPASVVAATEVPPETPFPNTTVEMQSSRSSVSSLRLANRRVGSNSQFRGAARHTLGLIILLIVVLLWTASNFLGSSIFADNSYAKPFFLTYLNTSTFIIPLIPVLLRKGYRKYRARELYHSIRTSLWRTSSESDESQAFLKPADVEASKTHLGLGPTARLSFTFCILWFLANYFVMACLQFTTVASATILTSTSSVWTLLIGAMTGTEKFTFRKLLGVLGALAGIALISTVDLSSSKPPDEGTLLIPRDSEGGIGGSFPDKTPSELFLGDTLAALSALVYGVYTITLKKASLGAEPLQLDMALFFGLVGLFNTLFLWPLFPILSVTGIEPFELPPTGRIWTILLVNSLFSLLSDILWAYAMLLTSPLVVTVGLSLNIPLSLVGEMVLQGRTEGWVYWVGAIIVVFSFVFVDQEEIREEKPEMEVVVESADGHDDRSPEGSPTANYFSLEQGERSTEE